MRRFEVEITGITPLMQHRMPEEALFGLMGIKSEKIKPMEELTPREIADRHVYKTTDGKYYIPMEYIAQAFVGAASEHKQKNSKRASLKAIAAGVFRPETETSTLLDPETDKPLTSYEVDVRKATNHQKGAVAACRPRFEKWRAKFIIGIDDTLVATATAQHVLEDAGRRVGIGSYRVAKRGYFGQFNVTKWEEL